MRLSRRLMIVSVALGCLLIPSSTWAQTCSAFSQVRPDGKPSQVFTSSTTSDHISFFFWAFAGRSYSVEVQNVSRSYLSGSFSMSVNNGDCPTTNLAGMTNTQALEPTPYAGNSSSFNRFSFTASATGVMEFRAGSTSGALDIQATAYDTTLYSNWFYVGGDYAAFTLIRNTTTASVNATVNWRNPAGALIKSVTLVIPGNGDTFVNGAAYPEVIAAGSGSVEIANNAPPSGLVASTTTLSATTGLSFDAGFNTRR